ncbi:MAG: FHA domain-containing protein [Lachnospiraceae bacterium]|nr:FHA domain-containing protein [Lachnospiraceae bacterium]MDE6253207.1 FHA domain-containing protein [Lachnospiraceae bacterium]
MDRHIKKGIAEIFDKLAWACMGSLVTCIIYLKIDIVIKVMLIAAVLAIGVVYMAVGYYMSINRLKIRISDDNIQTTRKGIESIVLLNEEKKVIKSFKIVGKAGLVIGKSDENNVVDVDLSDLAVSETISAEHAVLNYSNGNWYIEDSDSVSGTAVRRSYENDIHYLNKSEQIKLEPQDYIYVGKALLQVI